MIGRKFQIVSDIHIEKHYIDKNIEQDSGDISPPEIEEGDNTLLKITDFIDVSAPNLILAGDIGSIYHEKELQFFLASCKNEFENVIYVPGNNEFYLRKGYEMKEFVELENILIKICEEEGIIYMNNNYIELDDLIIFGSIWWSHIEEDPLMRIKFDGHTFNIDDFNYLHAKSRMCLNKVLEMKGEKKVLVITHYCPTKYGTMNNNHKRDEFKKIMQKYFSSSESYLVKDKVHTWIYGHTHVFRNFLFNGDQTRIVSNADPNKNFFKKNFTIVI